jgi:hypothetical protein
MAETTGTQTKTQRSTNGRKASTKRSTAAAKRSTTAKKAAQTRAAKSGTRARKRTTTAAKSRTTAAQRTTAQNTRQAELTVQAVAERAVLTSVGSALLVRDNLVDTVDELRTKYGTQAKAQRKLETQLRKAERRGETARKSLEREVKRTRTRVERELRQRRTRIERQTRPVAKNASAQAGLVGAQAENISVQLQNVLQSGLTAGTQVAAEVQKRVAALV